MVCVCEGLSHTWWCLGVIPGDTQGTIYDTKDSKQVMGWMQGKCFKLCVIFLALLMFLVSDEWVHISCSFRGKLSYALQYVSLPFVQADTIIVMM